MTDDRIEATRQIDYEIWAEVFQDAAPDEIMEYCRFGWPLEVAALVVVSLSATDPPAPILDRYTLHEIAESIERTLLYEAQPRRARSDKHQTN